MEEGLTDEQLQQQDFVDNNIQKMIDIVLGVRGQNRMGWNAEVHAQIREIIVDNYINSEEEEMKFYPWTKEGEKDD